MDILTFFKTNKNNIIIGIISLIVLGGIIGIIVYYTNKSSSPTPSSNNCPNNCSGNGTCSDITNTCSCNSGYSGPDCSNKIISCPGDCTDSDHGTCNTDGTCSCKPGFTGSDCSSKTCINNCSGNGTCNSDGTCSCKPGFTGDDCSSKTCPACGKHQSCNSKNGTCFCDSGYILDITGDCIKPCPKPCMHGGVCDEDTGLCTCSNQWKGDDCSQTTCPTALCGTGDSPICCANDESCISGSCCKTNLVCKDSTGVDVCCANGCCSDINGNKLCCAPGQSCTEGGCCDNDKVYTDKTTKLKYCCGKATCNGQCCNDEIEVCDPIKGCRTACGAETCDPETEVCGKITDKDDKVLQSCAKKDICQWSTDLIYNPASITTAPNTPLYLESDGTISWCQGGTEIAGNMVRHLQTRVSDPTKCSLGNCYQRLSQTDMNFVSWDEKSGLCEGVITAKDAPHCDGKCPTGIQDQSCCKTFDGSSNGLVCANGDVCGPDNKCYKGYECTLDITGQNTCTLSQSPLAQSLEGCQLVCPKCQPGFNTYNNNGKAACYREDLKYLPNNSSGSGADECKCSGLGCTSCNDTDPNKCGNPEYKHRCDNVLWNHCNGFCEIPDMNIPVDYWYCNYATEPSLWVKCKDQDGCQIGGYLNIDDRNSTLCPPFQLSKTN